MTGNIKTRLIGIDFGRKRVGVAVCDEARTIATPVSVIQNTPDLMAEIEKLCVEYETKELVLGESRDYKGDANEILLDSLKFKEVLEKRGLTVFWEPEFMTSIQAERIQGKTDKLDASAAALILQSYIDRARNEQQ